MLIGRNIQALFRANFQNDLITEMYCLDKRHCTLLEFKKHFERISYISIVLWVLPCGHMYFHKPNGKGQWLPVKWPKDSLVATINDICIFLVVYEIRYSLCTFVRNAFNSLRPRPNRRHFPADIFKCIFLNEDVLISIKISLKFVHKGQIKVAHT